MKTPNMRPEQVQKLLKQCKHIVRTTILEFYGENLEMWYAPLEKEHADAICAKLDQLGKEGK